MHELLAKARLEPGLKIKDKDWRPDRYVYWSTEKDCWLDENSNGLFLNIYHINHFDWELYKKPQKLVKWYRPAVIWNKNTKEPRFVGLNYKTTKTLSNWCLHPNSKVLKWDEIEAPETWEQCE